MKRFVRLLAVLLHVGAFGAAQDRTGAAPHQGPPAPRLGPGTVLRYQLEFRTTTQRERAGLIEDPQAPSRTEISWDAVVRIEVLAAKPEASSASTKAPSGSALPLTRLRATYEKSVAAIQSDTYDPAAAAIEEQYRQLQGKAIEFTVDAEGKVNIVQGLEEIVADAKTASSLREWLARLTGRALSLPAGMVPGQQWTVELPMASAPLAGLFWRTGSTYLRNEPCRRPAAPQTAPATPGQSPPADEPCAVILTRYEVAEPRAQGDLTPEDYRLHGLRTAGKWTGTAESLSYVSLRTGWVVSVTQSGTEEMDVTVSTVDGESRLRYAGRVRNLSQISLLPNSSSGLR